MNPLLVRLIALIVLAAVAAGVATLLRRRRPDPPSAPSYRAPSQLDRSEFVKPASPVLIAEFASTSCSTCPEVWKIVEPLGSAEVAVQRIDVELDPTLHQRYRIDGVPTTVIADADGVVVQAFFGPVQVEELVLAVQAMTGRSGEDT